MCGIMGYEGNSDIGKRMMPYLAIYMNDRGRDSWGVTDGKFTYKAIGQIVDQFEELDLTSPTYHCRGASVGAVSQRNAHPFYKQYTDPESGHTRRVTGVHNGHIHNHWNLKNKYPERKDFEVDSEHIFANLAELRPLRDLEGWGTVVWYEQIDDGPITRYFSKFGAHATLGIAKLVTNEIIFASTERSIQVAAKLAGTEIKFFYKVEPDLKYSIENGELINHGAFKWGWVYEPRDHASNIYNLNGNRNHDNREVCAMKDCKTIVPKDDLICTWCLKKIKTDYGFDPLSAYGAY